MKFEYIESTKIKPAFLSYFSQFFTPFPHGVNRLLSQPCLPIMRCHDLMSILNGSKGVRALKKTLVTVDVPRVTTNDIYDSHSLIFRR